MFNTDYHIEFTSIWLVLFLEKVEHFSWENIPWGEGGANAWDHPWDHKHPRPLPNNVGMSKQPPKTPAKSAKKNTKLVTQP